MDTSMIKAFAAMEFSKIFKKCILRYAKKYNYHFSHVYMMLGLDETGENVTYKTYVNAPDTISSYEPIKSMNIPNNYRPAVKEHITILNVLDVLFFHIKGYDQIAPPFIQASLTRLANENNLKPQDVAVLIYYDDTVIPVPPEEKKDIFLILCKVDGDQIKQMIGILSDMTELF